MGIEYDPQNLDHTITAFLKKYDREKAGIQNEFMKAYPQVDTEIWAKDLSEELSKNKELHALIRKILLKEREYKGSYVLYHGADSEVGFIYDVYSALRRLLTIQSQSDTPEQRVTRLRILDDAFLKIISSDDLINQMMLLERKFPNDLFNYLPGFQYVGLSAQWFLFGSYKYWFNSTFFLYFRHNTSLSKKSINSVLESFFLSLGITSSSLRNEIVNRYSELYKNYIFKNDGRLLQIFVAPEIIDEITYVSETGGYPLDLEMAETSHLTHLPSVLISEVMKEPLEFEKILELNRDNFKNQNGKDREEFHLEKIGLSYINSLEARFFMKPAYLDNPAKIQIINYHSHEPKVGYDKALDDQISRDIAIWLDLNQKLGLAMTYQMPPLVKLQDYVGRGTSNPKDMPVQRQLYTLYDLLSAGKWQEAEQWLKVNPDDLALKIDDQGHQVLYQLLYDNKFQAAQWLVNHGASVNGTNIQGEPIILDLLDDNKLEAAEFLFKNKVDLENGALKKLNLMDLLRKKRVNAALWLINKDAMVIDITDENKATPLIFASILGATDIIKALIQKKKEQGGNLKEYIDHQNRHGLNALMLTINRGNEEAALTLIKAGANPDVLDFDGETPLVLATTNGLTDVIKELIQKIKEQGGDLKKYVDHKNNFGDSAFMIAARSGYKEAAIIFIEAGADINAKNINGDPILFEVLSDEDFDLAKIMIAKGADVNARMGNNTQLLTRIFMTARPDGPNSIKIAKFLLNHGGKMDSSALDYKTIGGQKIRDFIQQSQDLELIKLLK